MKILSRKNKGITLVALVITIIILLILAGITISQLTGSGLFENAKLAEKEYTNSQELENTILKEYSDIIEENTRNNSEGYIKPEGTLKIDRSSEKIDVTNYKYVDTSDLHLKSEDLFEVLETGTYSTSSIRGSASVLQTITLKNTYTEEQNAYMIITSISTTGTITPYIDLLNSDDIGIMKFVTGNTKRFFVLNGNGNTSVSGSITFDYAIIRMIGTNNQ